jgi:hypothetical protein
MNKKIKDLRKKKKRIKKFNGFKIFSKAKIQKFFLDF